MHKASHHSVFNALHNIPNCQFYYVIHHLPVKYISMWLIMGRSIFFTGENSQDIKILFMLVSVLYMTDWDIKFMYNILQIQYDLFWGCSTFRCQQRMKNRILCKIFFIYYHQHVYYKKSYLADILTPRVNKGSDMKKVMIFSIFRINTT